jgi:hypothetical protein
MKTATLKVSASSIKREVLGNHSDCDCANCGYPMGCGDTAYTYADEVYCSKQCVYELNDGRPLDPYTDEPYTMLASDY